MVGTDQVEVDVRLRAGELGCPGCPGLLAPWGYARERVLRGEPGVLLRLRPRRGRCGDCGSTHVLLPSWALLRRADVVVVIGAALTAKAAGHGHRVIAAVLGRAASTVRGWLRAFASNAERVRAVCTAVLVELDPMAGPLTTAATPLADAVEVIGRVAGAAVRRLGVVPGVSAWQLASALTGGRLLAPAGPADSINTSWPLGAGR